MKSSSGEEKQRGLLPWPGFALLAWPQEGQLMANNRHQPAHPRASVGHCSGGDLLFPQFSSGKRRMEQARWEQNIPEAMVCTHHSV